MIAALFAAGPDLTNRVTAAFQWSTPPVPPPAPRLDAWVDPPGYTGRPPQFLARSQASDQPIPTGPAQAPVNSTLVLRASPADGVSVEVSGALQPIEGAPQPTDAIEKRFSLTGDGEAIVKRGGAVLGRFTLTAIPDRAPTVTLKEVAPTDTRDGLRLVYGITDDYGVKEGEARFSPIRKPGEWRGARWWRRPRRRSRCPMAASRRPTQRPWSISPTIPGPARAFSSS